MTMTNIEMKRGRLTERIGDAEHNRLPNKNPKNATLAVKVEDQRQKLERLLKRVARSKGDLEKIEEDVTLLQHVKNLHKTDKEHSANTIDKHNEEKRNLRGENVQIRKQLKHVRLENETREKTFQDFQKKADEREGHHAKMKNSAQEGPEESKQLTSQARMRNELKSEQAKMGKELKDLEAHLKKLKTQFEEKSRLKTTRAKSPKPNEFERQIKIETLQNLNQSNESTRQATRGAKTATGQSRVHFGRPEDLETLQEEAEKLANEIDEKEKEWMAVQDQISKIETSRTELTTKHLAEHQRKKHYEDRIDILELEPTPVEHRSTATSHSSTPSKRSSKSPKPRSNSRRSSVNSKKSQNSAKSPMETPPQAMIIPRIGAIATGSSTSKQKDLQSRRASAQESLKSDLSQSQKLHGHLKQEVERLEERVAQINKEKEHFSNQITAAQRKIQTSKQKIEQIRHSHDTQRARLEEYANEKERQAHSNIHQLTTTTKTVEDELKQLKEELKNHDEKIGGMYQRLHEAQTYQKNTQNLKDIMEINADLVDWKYKVRGAEHEYEALMELVKEAKGRNQKVKEDLTPVKPYFDEQSEYEKLKDKELLLNAELKDLKAMEELRKHQAKGDLMIV